MNPLQDTEEYHAARAGKVTASRIKDVVAEGRGITRMRYLTELLLVRMTGKTPASYCSRAMQAGIEREPMARAAYEFATDYTVDLCGFVSHPKMPNDAGCSPDGLIGSDGLVQFKCPEPHTHLSKLRKPVADREYVLQVQFEMACTGRQWCDLVSFCDDFPPQHQLVIIRIARDDDAIKTLNSAVRSFLADLLAEQNALWELRSAA